MQSSRCRLYIPLFLIEPSGLHCLILPTAPARERHRPVHCRCLLYQDALARDMSVLVFCSTKKWCQQTANLLAKEVLLDRNRAAAMASAAAAAAGKKCNANSNSLGRSKGKASLVGFGRAKSIAPAGAGAAVAKSTELRSGEREGMVAATQLGTGATETVAATAKEGSAAERLRPACPTAADTVRERLRQTPVGLDAELSYLVRHFRTVVGLANMDSKPSVDTPLLRCYRRTHTCCMCVRWDAYHPCPAFVPQPRFDDPTRLW